ncbi:hypothetical protein KWH45_12110 [Xanthomonas campestris pv. mirabilis]|uniref:hypothetical protein n=1 Tax=Xanthomonas euvesicatoria TaxID=456327 RepID=UPI001C46ABF0|nr:hypothetical protein [Xanthomonas euvesicatoria]MBV6854157.1 hypothetical protein [Xanthomonas campestris pv. mirabilis]
MRLRLPLFCAVSGIAVSWHEKPAISRQTYIGEQASADARVSGFDIAKWVSLSATGAIGQRSARPVELAGKPDCCAMADGRRCGRD